MVISGAVGENLIRVGNQLLSDDVILIDRYSSLLDLLIDAGAGFDMGHIKEIHFFSDSLLNIAQKANEAEALQAAVNEKINITFLCSRAFTVGTKQHSLSNS